MPRVTRSRTRDNVWPAGSYSFSSGGGAPTVLATNSSGFMTEEDCDDCIGRPVVASPLTINRVDRGFMTPINGTNVAPPWTWIANNYVIPKNRVEAISHLSITGIPPAAGDLITLIAKTNPSRPGITPLSMLQNLYDIPRQLAQIGRLIKSRRSALSPKEAANQYLGAQFGWLPLFRDVQDLLDLQSTVQKRIGELNRLYSGKGLKRRLPLGSWHAETSGNVIQETFPGIAFSAYEGKYTSVHRWGTVRWKPSILFQSYRPSDAEIINQAKRVARGLTVEGVLAGAWDLLPWTWLIDWFTNVHDVAMQYSNTIPAIPTSPCIMTEYSTTVSVAPTNLPSGYSGGGGVRYLSTKTRYTGAGSVTASLPFLDSGRLAILGALFIQRFK